MSKKTTALILVAAISASFAHSVRAESSAAYSMPPPGPYRTVADLDQYNFNQNDQTDLQLNRTNPEWVKQRQAQMKQQMQRSVPPAQVWNNQQAQQNYNQLPPMMNSGVYSGQRNSAGPYHYMGGYPSPNVVPNYQGSRMQQFPYAGAPAYGRNAPPEYYRQPAYPAPGY